MLYRIMNSFVAPGFTQVGLEGAISTPGDGESVFTFYQPFGTVLWRQVLRMFRLSINCSSIDKVLNLQNNVFLRSHIFV